MSDLIEALQIFQKYNDARWPTVCLHDVLCIIGVDPVDVSVEDTVRLDELGFFVDDPTESFVSVRFGSA